jgi:hypothetical protein
MKGETTRKRHYHTGCDEQFISDMNDTHTVSNSMVIWKTENKERHSFFACFFFDHFFFGNKRIIPPLQLNSFPVMIFSFFFYIYPGVI